MLMGGVMSPTGHCTFCGLRVRYAEGGLSPGDACPDRACPSHHRALWSTWDKGPDLPVVGPLDWSLVRARAEPFKEHIRSQVAGGRP